MLSQLKHALSHCTIFQDNFVYTIRFSAFLAYLRNIRHIAETESRPLGNAKYRTFFLLRLLFYFIVLKYVLRGLYIVHLMVQGRSLREHASLDPLLTTVVLSIPTLNYLTFSAMILLYFFQIPLDYFASFSYDYYIVTMLSNIVSNGAHFFTINPRLQLPQEMSLFRQPKESYLKLRHWYKRMLNPLSSPTFVHSIRPVTYVSPRLRTRLVLQCHLYEGAFACLHFITSKFNSLNFHCNTHTHTNRLIVSSLCSLSPSSLCCRCASSRVPTTIHRSLQRRLR